MKGLGEPAADAGAAACNENSISSEIHLDSSSKRHHNGILRPGRRVLAISIPMRAGVAPGTRGAASDQSELGRSGGPITKLEPILNGVIRITRSQDEATA